MPTDVGGVNPRHLPREKSYETHVSWALFEAARIEPDSGYGEAGLRQVDWALGKQLPNGWFKICCLTMDSAPLTHTLGYVLRGILEAYRYAPFDRFLEAATRLANALMEVQEPSGRIYGRYDSSWEPTVTWACLTGMSQITICWLLLDNLTNNSRYRATALNANRYVRCTVPLDGDPDTIGGVKGSFPIDGGYCPYRYLNWATKFCIDANLLEIEKRGQSIARTSPIAASLPEMSHAPMSSDSPSGLLPASPVRRSSRSVPE